MAGRAVGVADASLSIMGGADVRALSRLILLLVPTLLIGCRSTAIEHATPLAGPSATATSPGAIERLPSDGPSPAIDCSKYPHPEPHFDRDLEAAFPTSIGEVPLATPISFRFLHRLCQGDPMQSFLAALPNTIDPATISVADAYPQLISSPMLTAIRVPGHSASVLRDVFVSALLWNQHDDASATTETRDGRQIVVLHVGSQESYIYSADEILFLVSGADVRDLETILASLPRS
jgi:hypothetical protein